MKLDEKQLQHACKQALHIQIESLPDIAECPIHDFDEAFEQDIQKLIIDLEKGNISPAKAPMGWQYYIKKSTTATIETTLSDIDLLFQASSHFFIKNHSCYSCAVSHCSIKSIRTVSAASFSPKSRVSS